MKINENTKAIVLTNAYAAHTTIIISLKNCGFIVFCVREVKTKAGTARVIASRVTNSTRYSKPNLTQEYPNAASRNTGVTTSKKNNHMKLNRNTKGKYLQTSIRKVNRVGVK